MDDHLTTIPHYGGDATNLTDGNTVKGTQVLKNTSQEIKKGGPFYAGVSFTKMTNEVVSPTTICILTALTRNSFIKVCKIVPTRDLGATWDRCHRFDMMKVSVRQM